MFKLIFLLCFSAAFGKTFAGSYYYYQNYTAQVNKIVIDVLAKQKIQELNLTNECHQQLQWFKENLQKADDGNWALQMIDDSAKPPAGILTYNIIWLGNYKHCLNIESTKYNVKGQYCLATLSLPSVNQLNTRPLLGVLEHRKLLGTSNENDEQTTQKNLLYYGICLPDKCTETDVQVMSQKVLNLKTDTICQTKEYLNRPLSTGAIISIVFFAIVGVTMIISTIYDVLRDPAYEVHPLLVSFSVCTNGRKLFRVSQNSGEMGCLHGIRGLSMIWVVIGHTFLCVSMGPVSNTIDIYEYAFTQRSMIFTNALHSVDTFFVVTGMLVVYGFMKNNYSGKKFGLFLFYFHRYVRLTPPLIPTMLLTMYIINRIGSGPYYPLLDAGLIKNCEDNWWTTVLYVQNYVNPSYTCLGQTWYLNIDWQLHLLAPVFLLWLPRRPIIGLGLMLVAAIGAMAAGFVITWKNLLPAFAYSNAGNAADYNNYYYVTTHTRATTWLIGGVLGYLLARIKLDKNQLIVRLPMWLVCLIWAIVLAVVPVCIFGGHEERTSTEYHKFPNAFYNALTRPVWGLCIAWIIFACVMGYGGIINKFLSLPIFQVMGRFNYSIYLLHISIIFPIIMAQKQPRIFDLFDVTLSFWGFFVYVLGLSIFWVLAFESPVIILEKWLLGGFAKEQKKKSPI